MTKNFAANLKIGAIMGSSVGKVFGSVKRKMKDQETELKRLRAAYKEAAKGTGEYAGKLDELQREIDQTEAKLKRLRAASKVSLGDSVKGVGSAFAGDAKRLAMGAGIAAASVTAVGAAVVGTTKGFIDWADEIGDAAEALGMSTQALQTWQFAAATVGVGGSKMTASIAKFSKTIMDGGKKTDETLKKLGINAARLRKLGLDDQLAVVAESFKNYKGADRAALSMKLFGKSGYMLAGVLAKGKKGLDEFREAGEKTGAVLDDEAAKKAGEAAAAMDMLGITLIGLRNIFAIEMVPAFQEMASSLGQFVQSHGKEVREWAKKFGESLKNDVVPALVTFMKNLPGMISELSKVAKEFWENVKAVKDFVGGWGNLATAIVAINFIPTIAAVGSLGKSLWVLSGATWAAVGPWLALAAAIGAVVYTLTHQEEVGEKVYQFWEAIAGEEFVAKFWDSVLEYQLSYEAFIQWNIEKSAQLRQAVGEIFASIGEAMINGFKTAFEWIETKLNALMTTFSDFGSRVKSFFGFGGDTASSTAAPITPSDSMPSQSTTANQTNNWNINVNAPGGDGRRIADQLRSEFNRKPLYDMDSFAPAQ